MKAQWKPQWKSYRRDRYEPAARTDTSFTRVDGNVVEKYNF